MHRSRRFGAATLALVAALAPAAGIAQGLRGPAELPPPSYQSMQYVDSAGCAFVRAGMAGNVVWVPRVNRDRSQICGQPPTFGGGAPAMAAVTAAVEPPRRPAEGAPIETVASLTTAPDMGAGQQPAAVAAPVSAPMPVRLTLAQVCDGQTGVLPGYRTATGGPVDCGGGVPVAAMPVPAVAAATAQPEAATLTLAEACTGRIGPLVGYVNAATGQPVTCGDAPRVIAAAAVAPAVVPVAAPTAQMTLAQACAGRTGPLPGYVSALTGQPVTCGPAPAAVRADAADCPPGVVGGVAYRCGGAVYSDAAVAALAAAQVTRAPRQDDPFHPDFWREPIPASNPVVLREVIAPPPGYVPVFDDGRLNPQRGLVRAAG